MCGRTYGIMFMGFKQVKGHKIKSNLELYGGKAECEWFLSELRCVCGKTLMDQQQSD